MSRQARRLFKSAIDAACLVLVLPAALPCALEARLGGGEAMFTSWAQAFALVPGVPGVFLRRAFYRLTLEECAHSFSIGFGAMFSHRKATVEENVYVGPYAVVGSCRLGRGCLVGTRASVLSGGNLHALGIDGWAAADLGRMQRIDIGENAWIGESAVIVANVGRSAMIAAGSVVTTPVPAETMVGGNPARFVRRLREEVPSVPAVVPVR